MSQSGSYGNSNGLSPLNTITGNSGGPVGPDGSGNINVTGTSPLSFAGNPGTFTVNGSILTATTASTGVIQLATSAQAIAGVDAANGITSFTLGSKLGSQTLNGIAFGGGATAALSWTSAGTNGQVLLGSTGGAPAFATLTSSASTLVYTLGADSLNIDLTIPVIVSSGGTGRTTLTNHSLLVGAGTGALTQLGVAANGMLPIGSSGADPVLATITAGTGISVTNGAGSITIASTATSTLTITTVNHAASPYTVLSTDQFLAVDVSGGVVTLKLPNAPTTGQVWYIKDSKGAAFTSNITVTTVGGAVNIDGATSYTMNTNFAAISVVFDGTAYEIF